MFDANFVFFQKITAIFFLFLFFNGRIFWTYFKGKRKKANVSSEIVSGRFWITLIIYGLLPTALILNLFDLSEMTDLNYGFPIYLIGVLLAVCGIILMYLARMHRQKDWGFMGDISGEILFTQGVYSITRHPYYVGAFFLGIGVYFMLNSWLVLCMFPVLFFLKNVIRNEDEFLFKKFQNEWVVYKQKTGIIPFFLKISQK